MCPARDALPAPHPVLIELEQETYARARLSSDYDCKTMTHYLLEIIEREVYARELDEKELDDIKEGRSHTKGYRTPGAIPWSRGLSRAYRNRRR